MKCPRCNRDFLPWTTTHPLNLPLDVCPTCFIYIAKQYTDIEAWTILPEKDVVSSALDVLENILKKSNIHSEVRKEFEKIIAKERESLE